MNTPGVPTSVAARAYIAGPMTGKPEFNYPLFFQVEQMANEAGFLPLNPARLHGGDTGKPWEWYMKTAIRELLSCDCIVMLPDWFTSEGASIERFLAYKLKLRIIYLTKGDIDAWDSSKKLPETLKPAVAQNQ